MRRSPKLSPQENRKAWFFAALIVLALTLLAVLAVFGQGYEAVFLPPAGCELLQAAAALDDITIQAQLFPEERLLTATQTMTLRNPAGQALDHVVLRSYSGAYWTEETSPAASDELFAACYGDTFSPGGLSLTAALLNGEAVMPTWSDDRTALTLPVSWPADEAITLQLVYEVLIPECGSRFGVKDGVIALGNVFPTLSVWENGAFRTDRYIAIGDPFMSECANWHMTLTLPKGYSVAASGAASFQELTDVSRYTIQAPAMRDVALVISDQLTSHAAMADDVLITAYARDRKAAQRMVTFARQAIACYEKHYGPYLYPAFTLAEVSFPYGGMEYPGMVMIGSPAIAQTDDTLEVTVAHETAHQWWYGMVGSDSYNQAWQDESLCEYALMDYIGDTYGASSRESAVFDRIETALRITIPRGVTPGSPIDYFQDLTEYTQVVYRRGAALWMALENLMGKQALDAALQDYQKTFRCAIASRDDVAALLSRHAGQNVAPLMEDYLDTYITN